MPMRMKWKSSPCVALVRVAVCHRSGPKPAPSDSWSALKANHSFDLSYGQRRYEKQGRPPLRSALT
jgi:hypothetical protein